MLKASKDLNTVWEARTPSQKQCGNPDYLPARWSMPLSG